MKDNFSYPFSLSFFQFMELYHSKDKKKVRDELDIIVQAFNKNKKIYQFFGHPNIHLIIKKNLIEKIVKNEILKRMIILLVKIKKINQLQEINQFYNVLLSMKSDYITGEVQTPWEINSSLLNAISNGLEKYFKKKVNINVVKNPEILGGIYIKIQNVIFDYTINNALETFIERFKSENR